MDAWEFGSVLVSIHAPTRGATAIPEFDRLGNEVSIHAPARGATRDNRDLHAVPRGGAWDLSPISEFFCQKKLCRPPRGGVD